MKTKYLNLGLVLCLVLGSLLTAYPAQAQPSGEDDFPPCAFPIGEKFFFWNDPADPSIFDWITFGLDGCIPPETWVCSWDFGDGTISNDGACFVYKNKRYQADGDYTVQVQITEGIESATLSRVVSVRTHDVAITKFTVPQSARAGQTRQLSVGVRNTRYLELVQVELYEITASGDVWVGTLKQTVPVRSRNRTTTFNFSYTFTAEDARVGKVTFKALAFLLNDVRDAWPADNEAISLPTNVSR